MYVEERTTKTKSIVQIVWHAVYVINLTNKPVRPSYVPYQYLFSPKTC